MMKLMNISQENQEAAVTKTEDIIWKMHTFSDCEKERIYLFIYF